MVSNERQEVKEGTPPNSVSTKHEGEGRRKDEAEEVCGEPVHTSFLGSTGEAAGHLNKDYGFLSMAHFRNKCFNYIRQQLA